MECPYCNVEMHEGTAQVRGSFWDFLLVGYSLQDLCFHHDADSQVILHSREKRQAFSCPSCGGCFIMPLPSPSMPVEKINPVTGVVTQADEESQQGRLL